MGLDMYLTKEIYIGASHKYRDIQGSINISSKGVPIKINFEKVSTIVEDVGYWRKAYAINNWFIKEVQNNKDDYKPYLVSFEKLVSLKNLCQLTLKNEVPDDYWYKNYGETPETSDLEDTIRIIDGLEKGTYIYQAG